MLTWSNWFTEMRSNRFHYATRFSKHLPVIFIQVAKSPNHIVKINDYNIYVCNIDSISIDAVNNILDELELKAPLVWTYNLYFSEILDLIYSPLKIYHATEDYFCDDFMNDSSLRAHAHKVIEQVDIAVCVSEGVEANIKKNVRNRNIRTLVLTNGCDYDFWGSDHAHTETPKVIVYQGGISKKINFDLLKKVAHSLDDWKIFFCGEEITTDPSWQELKQLPNVSYLGKLPPEKVKELCVNARVGIIPFHQNDWLTSRSFPLKAFEYAAANLAVVATPIEAIQKYSDIFDFAVTDEEFIQKIQLYENPDEIDRKTDLRRKHCKMQDYNLKFDRLIDELKISYRAPKQGIPDKKRVLVLYDCNSCRVNTIKEHLSSFSAHSKNDVYFYNATGNFKIPLELNNFHAVVIHYSVRISFSYHTNPYVYEKLKQYKGLKILFIQDEYDNLPTTRKNIETINFHIIYTCVPDRYVNTVYPFPKTTFVNTLTGYIPDNIDEYLRCQIDFEKRSNYIAYRGRDLPYWYGSLGQEKITIGKKTKELCRQFKIPHDIEWEQDKRIYGKDWYSFLASSRATLGTESGSNVFDFEGHIQNQITEELEKNPNFSYEEAYNKYLKDVDGKILMNQISPKIFESILLKVALILFEGEYSGVLKPNVHYIPLKKDFSNFNDIILKLKDIDYLKKMTQAAFNDIYLSGKYSYKTFISDFDKVLDTHCFSAKTKFNSLVLSSPSFSESVVFTQPWENIYDISLLNQKYTWTPPITVVRTSRPSLARSGYLVAVTAAHLYSIITTPFNMGSNSVYGQRAQKNYERIRQSFKKIYATLTQYGAKVGYSRGKG
jgi:hypothetical protein